MNLADENMSGNTLPEEASLTPILEALLYQLQNLPSENNEKDQLLNKIRVKLNLKTDKDPVLTIYLSNSERETRELAAKILDNREIPVSNENATILLGNDTFEILSDYLKYTRASHIDLLSIVINNGKTPPVAESIKQCEIICGEYLLRDVIAKIGWRSVNYGISVKSYTGISFEESLPLFVTASEAAFFESTVKSKKVSEYYIFTAHGGLSYDLLKGNNYSNKQVMLFRSYNLAHANLLQEILDVAPLSEGKISEIIKQMDKIVEDFITLFNSYSEECSILPDIYKRIKNQVTSGLKNVGNRAPIPAGVTRLVQMFEDPKTIGEVHTLHGLKRYLHQKGLELGSRLVDQSHSPNQNVSIALGAGSRVLSVITKINFADFEPENKTGSTSINIPYSVQIVIDGFIRQLLHGLKNFPSVNIFCYGNEIHYFVWFRNHPVFIRIDYSPPLQGGMIDLQYFGVSNYELADHPDINLEAIRYFFEYLEFNVEMEGTHIHARYDKERALALDQLYERVTYLFCLTPYLMDLDWITGSLNLDINARKKVIAAWAEFFYNWGALPYHRFLTKDNLGILQDMLITPEGDYELVWSGEDSYQDLYTRSIPGDFLEKIFYSIREIGLVIPEFSVDYFNQFGQIFLEKKILSFLRESVSAGEIAEFREGFTKKDNNLFQRIHEASCFAEIIRHGGKELKSCLVLGKLIAPLEKILKFGTTGILENYQVQTAFLPLTGETYQLFVLRDHQSIIRMAFYITGKILFKKRENLNNQWVTNICLSSAHFLSKLRTNNYIQVGTEPLVELPDEEIKLIDSQLLRKTEQDVSIAGEKIITGLSASPGRTAQRVLLGSYGKMPEDFDNKIFAAPSISPGENTIIYHSAGVISTGGGILSHAGLIATQFNKPSLIIPGRWKQESDGLMVLFFKTAEYHVEHKQVEGFNITIYNDLHEREYQLRDGDLVILDADKGSLEVLGQERDTIAISENLKLLGCINEQIANTTNTYELLAARGNKLHIRHQLEKLLKRTSDVFLARYAVKEILLGGFSRANRSTPDERAYLLNLLLENNETGRISRQCILQTINEIKNKFNNALMEAEKYITTAKYPFEIVMPRLELYRLYETIKNISSSLDNRIIEYNDAKTNLDHLDTVCIKILEELKFNLAEKIQSYKKYTDKKEFVRHLSRQLKRIEILLGITATEKLSLVNDQFDMEDQDICSKLSEKYTLRPCDGAFGLSSLIGWKAANLAELEMTFGMGLIPPWFVITDTVFQKVLDMPVSSNNGFSLFESINDIISRKDIDNKEKAAQISNLWRIVSIPEEIREEIINSYRKLQSEFISEADEKEKSSGFFVALRSSSCEEDAETAAQAGEFETYLFISGEETLIEYLKRTWSGLWTERAIHNRSVFDKRDNRARGGVIVQRIIWSRVSGVMQTINSAKGNLKEIVINAGLGLGEGIVSGVAASDQVIVLKEDALEEGHLNFNYITADKTNQVLFNRKAGFGTVISQTLYHQRFRPALEYVELGELVSTASKLEKIYGYPLDIEFGIEDTKLWILQVRPITTFIPALTATIRDYPIRKNEIIKEELT